MATFVTLARDNSGDIIHVNMDYVIKMEAVSNYTALYLEGDKNETVKETPSQILDLARRSSKS